LDFSKARGDETPPKVCPHHPDRDLSSVGARGNALQELLVQFEKYAAYGLVTRHRRVIPTLGFWPARDPIVNSVLFSVGYPQLCKKRAVEVEGAVEDITAALKRLGVESPDFFATGTIQKEIEDQLQRRMAELDKDHQGLTSRLANIKYVEHELTKAREDLERQVRKMAALQDVRERQIASAVKLAEFEAKLGIEAEAGVNAAATARPKSLGQKKAEATSAPKGKAKPETITSGEAARIAALEAEHQSLKDKINQLLDPKGGKRSADKSDLPRGRSPSSAGSSSHKKRFASDRKESSDSRCSSYRSEHSRRDESSSSSRRDRSDHRRGGPGCTEHGRSGLDHAGSRGGGRDVPSFGPRGGRGGGGQRGRGKEPSYRGGARRHDYF